jgi:hypothetical protein
MSKFLEGGMSLTRLPFRQQSPFNAGGFSNAEMSKGNDSSASPTMP